MGRSCARPACSGSATTTLSYDYANATVWIEPLHPERHPMHHDLCKRHALRLSVPRGWTLVDGRVEASPVGGAGVVGEGADVQARRGADAWDPSGTVDHCADAVADLAESGADTVDHAVAVVFEPTLFGDWLAEDDRHSLAS